ncbi:HEPN domain-containing protein [Pedobacter petrophilus]|uniref:HEPN domain-containing protein n=1 Tax=Pedobacter petrophilus TaxID=1908241 RepID=A0A7K0FWK6_9SPHI|nr:HEPN domain-containing protein [Pedobacter petrophilus]MRX75610.1 HEPN domain-containing protein [Pedobacter petrophilus]
MNHIFANQVSSNLTENINHISSLPDQKLNHLLELLTNIIPIAYIFRCTPNAARISLILVLDQHRYQATEETKDILKFLALSQINVELIYYSYGTINDLLQRGDLFFATYCRRVNCIYQHTANYDFIESSDITLAAMKSSSMAILNNGLEKANNFFEGATAYLAMGRLHLAAFMLHQTCEQVLKLIIKLYNGKDFKSHQLALLQKNAGFYFPEINNIFDTKASKELKWLELLQQAYVGARYDDDYKIEPKHLSFLQERTLQMLNKIRKHGLILD